MALREGHDGEGKTNVSKGEDDRDGGEVRQK